jgi:hypothetical protein
VAAARSFWDLIRDSGGVYESTISGTSMEPTLAHGASVRIRPLPRGAYREGQIVACALKDELFAHRIVFCGAEAIVTRGDNRVLCDPPTPKGEIVGLVEACRTGESWSAPAGPPAPRWPAITSSNLRLVRASLDVHPELGRRVAGTVLHIGRLLNIAGTLARIRSAPKA